MKHILLTIGFVGLALFPFSQEVCNDGIDNDGDGKPDDPVPGIVNRVYAQVKNNGGDPVGNAEIRFYFADAGTLSASHASKGSIRRSSAALSKNSAPPT